MRDLLERVGLGIAAVSVTGCLLAGGGVVEESSPRIDAFTANPPVLFVGTAISEEDTIRLSCRATDPDGDAIRYTFRASSGNVFSLGGTEALYLPDRFGEHVMSCDACDATACDHAEVTVEVRT